MPTDPDRTASTSVIPGAVYWLVILLFVLNVNCVGLLVGWPVGWVDGCIDGWSEGCPVGFEDGCVGCDVG